ncbi:hypothetical protein [Oceanotoga sp.]|jgi:hypothetical protein|uniref:DUF7033 domain-containing protein n=1 Tax=Oceanotoga sp. TaxID=2108366 RepID=UPI00280597D9|nr:hypothetical protein [Oceanotoga sp.]
MKYEIIHYIVEYFKDIFNESINLKIEDNYYVLNNTLRYKIYEFWTKKDSELFLDFNDYSFKGDYIGTIFFFLSGYWEYNHDDTKDDHGRFLASESFSYKKGILEEPIVEILTEKIKNELNLTYKNENSRVFITHDIDLLGFARGKKFIRNILGDILKRKQFKLAFDKIIRKISRRDPVTVYNLLNIHKKYGSKGTFFFMPDIQPNFYGGCGYKPIKDKRYLIDLEKEILSTGSRVGIHYDARHLKDDRMKEDIGILNNVFESDISCGRAHYLLFDIKKSFDIYERSGIKLDSTCSYADSIGFRFGTCKPFRPYNFKEKRLYDFYEYPLIIMEGTLMDTRYMGLSPEKGFEKIKELIDKIDNYNGVFTFLWHNTSFYIPEWKDWEWVYEDTIKYVKNKGFEFI